jgi:hypothetical protein
VGDHPVDKIIHKLKVSREEFIDIQDKAAVCDPSVVNAALARVPPSWELIHKAEDGAAFQRGAVRVIVGISRESDHKIWLHVSASTPRAYPTWEELKRVKHDFIGEDRWAYQVFPSQKDYVNINPYVLHLFSRLEGEPALPDFTRGTGSL